MSNKKRCCLFIVIIFALVAFSGCNNKVILPADDGHATAEVGETLRSPQREITVVSAKTVKSYGPYTPLAGEQLVDVVIKTKNCSGNALLLDETDYQLQWGTQGFADPLLAAMDESLSPIGTSLENGKTVEYHYLFSVPDYTAVFQVCYFEQGVPDKPNILFRINFTL